MQRSYLIRDAHRRIVKHFVTAFLLIPNLSNWLYGRSTLFSCIAVLILSLNILLQVYQFKCRFTKMLIIIFSAVTVLK